MDLVLLGALLSLGAPLSGSQEVSNSCVPLDCALPGGTLSIDKPIFQSYMQEATNGTSHQTKRHWGYYVLIVVALTGSLAFLCFCSPALKWLLSLCLRSNGDETRSPLRDARCSQSRPRNYGTLSETVAPPPPIHKDARGHAGGQGAPQEDPIAPAEKPGDQMEIAGGQGAPQEDPNAPAEKCGDQTEVAPEITLEVEGTA